MSQIFIKFVIPGSPIENPGCILKIHRLSDDQKPEYVCILEVIECLRVQVCFPSILRQVATWSVCESNGLITK